MMKIILELKNNAGKALHKNEMIRPPYKITTEILNFVIEITEKVGRIHAQYIGRSSPKLRKQNRIKTIHASLKLKSTP